MRGQEYPGADLRGWLLACVVRVSTRTRLPRRLGAYPDVHATASDGGRWPAPTDALPVGHRRRYQGLLRQYRPPPIDEAGSRSRYRWQGHEVDRTVLEIRSSGGWLPASDRQRHSSRWCDHAPYTKGNLGFRVSACHHLAG